MDGESARKEACDARISCGLREGVLDLPVRPQQCNAARVFHRCVMHAHRLPIIELAKTRSRPISLYSRRVPCAVEGGKWVVNNRLPGVAIWLVGQRTGRSVPPTAEGDQNDWYRGRAARSGPRAGTASIRLAEHFARQPARRGSHGLAVAQPQHHLRVIAPAYGEREPRAQVRNLYRLVQERSR